MKYILVIIICLTLIALTACQPTPEHAVVIDKRNIENKITESQEPNSTNLSPEPYDAPTNISEEMDVLPGNYRIVFDAEVDVSNQSYWPVYIVAPARVTQQQADTVRASLLGDTVLLKPSEYRTHEEIERQIKGYEEELRISSEEGCTELVGIYQGFLKNLYAELQRTPEDVELEVADTEFSFMENRVMPELYGGKETETNDGGFRYEWTDEARERAIDAGCENIYGICWLDNGRKMEFSVINNERSTCINFGEAEGNLVWDVGVTYSMEEAVKKADALLEDMGLGFTLVEKDSQPRKKLNEQDEFVEDGIAFHRLIYKPNITGVPQDNIQCSGVQIRNEGLPFRNRVPSQQCITITMDDYGISYFSWYGLTSITDTENENVVLLSFNEVTERIKQQLKLQTLWDENEAEYIDGRRLEVYKIKLSYIQTAVPNDFEHYYLTPVWNVCGDMYYHYKDSYPTGEHDTYILDENFERNVWRNKYDTSDYSILTINAIDGSVVSRNRGY